MSKYLQYAADLITQAAASNESQYGVLARRKEEFSQHRERMAELYQLTALRLADAYAALAAIDKGLVPEDLADLVKTVINRLPDLDPAR
ncbi:hypothetical protein [Amycolatopsis sp. NPDC058986]|uniref:hypothetical protein n=1 Tax=unclassified Amycolatopsis TaxID=2618356 RepID=UPI00366E4883